MDLLDWQAVVLLALLGIGVAILARAIDGRGE